MSQIRDIIQSSIQVKEELLHNEAKQAMIHQIAMTIVASLQSGGRIYFCGNGGSAADAQHLAAELSGRFYADRPALPAEALHANTSYITAVANDYSYEVIYSRIIEGCGKSQDVIIGLSTSGNSPNILRALKAANELGACSVALTGASGGQMKDLARYCLCADSADTPRIQETHILIGHIICQIVEESMIKAK
ncbi:MAG: SIS domain-containing protein [Saprospiraceae bacterium]